MTGVSQYAFPRSLAVLESYRFLNCARCRERSSSLASSTACSHSLCPDCLQAADACCPVPDCNTPVQPQDYQANRTLLQVASCVDNIQSLLHQLQKSKDDETVGNIGGSEKLANSREQFPLPKLKKKTPEGLTVSSKRSAGKKLSSKNRIKTFLDTSGEDEVEPVDIKKSKAKKPRPSLPVSNKAKTSKIGITDERKKFRQSLPLRKKTDSIPFESSVTPIRSNVKITNFSPNQSKSLPTPSTDKKNKKGETRLHAVCSRLNNQAGDQAAQEKVEEVRLLLEAGSDPNTVDHAGWSPLHEVAAAGRVEVAALLLEAGARPGPASAADRLTPLHEAVLAGHAEVAKLLLEFGAPREARDKWGRTPKTLSRDLGGEMVDIIEKTKSRQNDAEVSMPATSFETNEIKPGDLVVCVSKLLSKDGKLYKELKEVASKLKVKSLSREVSSKMNVFLVKDGEDSKEWKNSFPCLAAVANGGEILSHKWLLGNDLNEVNMGKYRQCLDSSSQTGDHADLAPGVKKAREIGAGCQPGLLAAIHFYLAGRFDPPSLSKAELQQIIKMCGGILVRKEPDPEWISEEDLTVAHHADQASCMANLSHVILYQPGDRMEPEMKYNMKHIKTLPVSWIVKCINSGAIVEP